MTVSGPDAETLLHNVMTCDIHKIADDVRQPGALLSPQGKVLFQFLVGKDSDGEFQIDIPEADADAFLKRMTMYRLRSKVDFSPIDQASVSVVWETDSAPAEAFKRDIRFPETMPVFRGPPIAQASKDEAYSALRIEFGVPEPGIDYELGDAFAHDISFDQNGGVDFKKGCYVGQEIVSRMQHRGTARRRLVTVTGSGLVTGENVIANGKPVGSIGTVVDDRALAIVRLDRIQTAKEADEPIQVGDALVTVELPKNVSYTWPET